MDKHKIKQLIGQGRIDKALDQLIEEINQIGDAQTKNDFILQSSRLKRILREKNLGIESPEYANLTINQITTGVLAMIDEVETVAKKIKEPETSETEKNSDHLILTELSEILGQEVKSISLSKRDTILHQLELYRIHIQNLESAEKASAKWGELAPPIILHRIADGKEKIKEVINQLRSLL